MIRRNICLYIALLCVAAVVSSCSSSYSVYSTRVAADREMTGGILYALPKTLVRVDIMVEKTDYDASPYAEYAEELLGIELADDEGAIHKITNVAITAINKPDPEAYYYIEPNGSDISVQLTRNGLLRSINTYIEQPAEPAQPTNKVNKVSKINLTDILYEPATYDDEEDDDEYDEEESDTAMAKPRRSAPTATSATLHDKAKAAAKIIMDIRTKKREILYGEYESEYDSKTISEVYSRLEEQEQKYMQLFVGIKSTYKEVFYIEPDLSKVIVDDQTVELFRFAEDRGVVDSTVVDADIIYCNLRCENEMYVVNKFLKQKPKNYFKYSSKSRHASKGFRYRVPELVTVSLITPHFTYQHEVKVAQYGPVMELPHTDLEAMFDEQTGELIYFNTL